MSYHGLLHGSEVMEVNVETYLGRTQTLISSIYIYNINRNFGRCWYCQEDSEMHSNAKQAEEALD